MFVPFLIQFQKEHVLLFELNLISLLSKCAFVIKFACDNLAAIVSAVNLNGLVIYLSWSISVTFFSISLTFVFFFH